MAGPYDYTIQAPNIAGSIAGGLKSGLELGAATQAAEAQKADALRRQSFSADLESHLANPTSQSTSALIAKYPEFQKSIAKSFEVYSQGEKEGIFRDGIQAISAIRNGKPDVARKILEDRITATENSGRDATDLKNLLSQFDNDPKAVESGLALTMSGLDPEKFSKIAGEQRAAEKAPAELSLAQSKAGKAAVDAKFAESAAVQNLQKGGWEIQKLANDIGISKLNSQIAAMNAATSRERNDLKRQELGLKVQEKIDARDAKVNEKSAELTSARASIDNMLNTADRVLQTPANTVSSAAGPISSRTPTLSADTADFEELLNTLSSQAFMAQIPALKGMGALSNAEGEKLQSSLQNLSLRQSPERLMENVREAQRLIIKSRDNLSNKFGVPNVIPDRPALQSQPASSGFKVLGVE